MIGGLFVANNQYRVFAGRANPNPIRLLKLPDTAKVEKLQLQDIENGGESLDVLKAWLVDSALDVADQGGRNFGEFSELFLCEALRHPQQLQSNSETLL
jgi:hypothetical protein